jgi:hypothetical protein
MSLLYIDDNSLNIIFESVFSNSLIDLLNLRKTCKYIKNLIDPILNQLSTIKIKYKLQQLNYYSLTSSINDNFVTDYIYCFKIYYNNELHPMVINYSPYTFGCEYKFMKNINIDNKFIVSLCMKKLMKDDKIDHFNFSIGKFNIYNSKIYSFRKFANTINKKIKQSYDLYVGNHKIKYDNNFIIY